MKWTQFSFEDKCLPNFFSFHAPKFYLNEFKMRPNLCRLARLKEPSMKLKHLFLVYVLTFVGLSVFSDATFSEESTSILSVTVNGIQGNKTSYVPSISNSGRRIVFLSEASNFVPGNCTTPPLGDCNNVTDVFLKDLDTLEIKRINLAWNGTQSFNINTGWPVISGDGRYVMFSSYSGLTQNDTNSFSDIFLYNVDQPSIELLSVDYLGGPANSHSTSPRFSPDGRYAVFASFATDLTNEPDPDLINSVPLDVFLVDLQTPVPGPAVGPTTKITDHIFALHNGQQRRIVMGHNPTASENANRIAFGCGLEGPTQLDQPRGICVFDRNTGQVWYRELYLGVFQQPDISDDGKVVLFSTRDNTLVPGVPTTDRIEIYTWWIESNIFQRIEVSSDGTPGNSIGGLGGPLGPESNIIIGPSRLSADGRFVYFPSLSTNLVSNDTNNATDIFRHNLFTRETTRIELISPPGVTQTNGNSAYPAVTPDGRFMAFTSYASNITPDGNGKADVFLKDIDVYLSCAEDLNGDGAIDFRDLNILLANFSFSGPLIAGDLNFDGVVDFLDLNIFLSSYSSLCEGP